ncbi:MAG: MarR family EPS-associated transcriptional regulator [Burkholderiaceae bacterium]|nr:MarR family EPS-associated transcriptional regulator [Burkholderiaceae bacterium]
MPPASQSTDVDTARALGAMRLLAERPELSQRELSHELGLSLGKTHYVLHSLLDKGLVKIRNFRRNDNKLAYAYLLTPKGVREKLRLTRRFLARKEAEFELLQATIAQLRNEVLVGDDKESVESDLSSRP